MGFVQNSFALTAAAVTSRSRLHLPECEKAKEKTKLKTKQRKPLNSLLYPWNYNHQLSHRLLFGHPTASSLSSDQIPLSPVNLPPRQRHSLGHEAAGSSRAGGCSRFPDSNWDLLGTESFCLNTWYHLTRRISVLFYSFDNTEPRFSLHVLFL